VAALLSALMTRSRKGPLWGAHRENVKWLVLRGIFGGTTIITSFLAVLVSSRLEHNEGFLCAQSVMYLLYAYYEYSQVSIVVDWRSRDINCYCL